MLSYVVHTPETSPPPPPSLSSSTLASLSSSLSSPASASSSSSSSTSTSTALTGIHQHGVHVVSPQRNSLSLNLNLNLSTANSSNSNSSSNSKSNNVISTASSINEGNTNTKLKTTTTTATTTTEQTTKATTLSQLPSSKEYVDAMLANMNAASATAAAATTAANDSSAVAAHSPDTSDERTHLLSNTPTPPPSLSLQLQLPLMGTTATTTTTTSSSAAAAETAAATANIEAATRISTLPPVHPSNPSRSRPTSVISSCTFNNNNNNNNNNKNISANIGDNNNSNNLTNTAANNNNTAATAGAAATATTTTTTTVAAIDAIDYDADDLSEEAGTAPETSANADSDISDKQQFPPRQTSKKPKLSKLGTKSVGLKRVSFGSSKGSMVETLVFETPTPLSEHVEPSFGFESTAMLLDGSVGASSMPGTTNAPSVATSMTKSNSSLMPLMQNPYSKLNMDDSGIEVQEESERSIVRVSIYQSSQPQQICPPSAEYLQRYDDANFDNSFGSFNSNYDYNNMMTTATTTTTQTTSGGTVTIIGGYDRQQSTDSGWDNPFRPGGDLSREADEIVNMIRGGKPITPTEDHAIGNGNAQRSSGADDDNCNGGAAIGESVTKTTLTQNQSAQNGTNSHKVQSSSTSTATTTTAAAAAGGGGGVTGTGANENNGVTSLAQVSKQVVPGPTSASHVVIDEKKNKKKGCCVIQ